MAIDPIETPNVLGIINGLIDEGRASTNAIGAIMDSFVSAVAEPTFIETPAPLSQGIENPGAVNLVSGELEFPAPVALPDYEETAELEIPGIVFPPIPDIDIPEFTGSLVPIEFPEPPDVVWPVLDATAPEESDVIIPLPPDFTLPPVPSFEPIALPDPPEFEDVVFDESAPAMDLLPPATLILWSEYDTDHAIRDAVDAKLLEMVRSGGTGVGASVQDGIRLRALLRHGEDRDAAMSEMSAFFSARGFSVPAGAISARLSEMSAKLDSSERVLGYDWTESVAQAEHDNLHESLKKTIDFGRMVATIVGNQAQRMFDSALAVAENSVLQYQARVKAFVALTSAYKVKAQVYETRIQAEISRAQIYRTRIEALREANRANMSMVKLYAAQIGAVLSAIEVYKAQIEGTKARLEVDENRLKLFNTRLEAYTIQINAVTARYNAYQAQVAGEKEKAQVFNTLVDAYNKLVDAYEHAIDSQISVTRIENYVHRADVALQEGTAAGVRASIDLSAAAIRATIGVAREQAETAYLGMANAAESLRATGVSSTVNAIVAAANASVAVSSSRGLSAVGVSNARASASRQSAAARAGAIAQSAVISQHNNSFVTTTSTNDSSSMSKTISRSNSSDRSRNTSVSTSHNYHYRH